MNYSWRRRYQRIRFSSRQFQSGNLISQKLRFYGIRALNFLFSYFPHILVGTLLFLLLMFLFYSKDLPSPDKVQRKEGFSTVILDRNEKPIYDIYSDKNRIPVPLTDIPDYLKKATIAIEDKDFYKHQGFSTRGILRAVFNILTLKGLQGGSTLTQQLVKNVLLTSERTLPRKFKEFILAVQIERKYSKDEILQMYLNEAPYGGTMWGIESAAQGYFSKKAKELTFTESVILAGLPQRPSYYSPFTGSNNAYKERAEEVLRRMREDGYITSIQEKNYQKEIESFNFTKTSASFYAPHFVEYVKKQLIDKFGEKKVNEGGLRVVTTLDLTIQAETEKIVREELDKIKGLNVSNGAALVMDPQSGEILAYVGSKEYESEDEDFQGKFDVVRQGLRQPGSALKPVTYAVAFSKNYTPSSLVMDVETKFPGGANNPDYIPKNYDGKFRGPVQLRFALANSINIPAVKLTALVGVRDILETAGELGLSTLTPTRENESRLGLSITLGGGEVSLLELTNAYGVFANKGVKNDIVSVLEVSDASGKMLFEHKKTNGKRVLGEDVTFLVSHILLDNNARAEVFGERSYLVIPGKTVAVKTGTTDDKKDNWTLGYSPSFVTGVWVGNNDNTAMDPKLASGVSGAAPIWNRIMRFVLKDTPDEQFTQPENIISLTVDAFAGGLPKENRPTRSEYFIKGTEPTQTSPVYQKLKLSRSDSSRLANAVEIASGNYEEKDFLVFTETDPTSDNENRWQEGINKWLEGQSDPLYHPPTQTSDNQAADIIVNIRKPGNKEQINDNNIEISVQAASNKGIKKIELFLDGNKKDEFDSSSFSKSYNLETGIHLIKAKAFDNDNKSAESEVIVGVKVSADPTDTPAPLPSPTPLTTQVMATP